MKLELISFALCPYVQRSVITLLHKKVPHSIIFIDLMNPPEWFDRLSPLGRVPVLKIDEREVLFESAVINEYLDEITPPALLPRDPLTKAKERAWIEFGSELLGIHYTLSSTTDQAEFNATKKEFFGHLGRVEPVLDPIGPRFRGKEVSLIDTSWAPLFHRMSLEPALWNADEWKTIPKARRWAEALVNWDLVRQSVVEDFNEQYTSYLRDQGSFIIS